MNNRLWIAAAVLALSPLASASASGIRPVKVECWSDAGCQNTTLIQVCESVSESVNRGQAPTVSCSQTAWSSGYNWPDYSPFNDTRSCGAATCEVTRMIDWDTSLGALCRDTGGYDAIVFCPVN